MADSTTVDTAPETGAGTVPPLVVEVTNKIAVPIVDKSGNAKGTVEIDPAAFGGRISRQLMHDVVLMYLANQRAGTHHTLRRGQVAGSTKRLFRQKGTGNARVGPKRSNKRVGGGTAKGPKPRDYEYHLPKKAVRAATRMALLSKFQDQETVVVDDLRLPEVRTKQMVEVLEALNLDGTTCLVGLGAAEVDEDKTVYLSARNIAGVAVAPASQFNAYG